MPTLYNAERKRLRTPGVLSLVERVPFSYNSIVKSMLHFNAPDGSNLFYEDSTFPRVWTPHENAVISMAQSKFGMSSGLFNGYGYIDTPSSSDFNLGTSDFTIEFFIFPVSNTTLQRVMGQADNTLLATSRSFYISITPADSKIRGGVVSGSTIYESASSAVIPTYTWNHVALVRSGNSLFIFLNGVIGSTVSVTGITVNSSPNKLGIGIIGEYTGTPFNGWIDEFRFTNGLARYTSDFTVPSNEF